MKCLFIIPFFLTLYSSTFEKSTKKTFYYFCVSKSWESVNQTDKNFILITEVKGIDCEEAYFKTKAAEWRILADSLCENKSGCTSDLNYYPTFNDAKIQFDKAWQFYSDTKKYYLKKVYF